MIIYLVSVALALAQASCSSVQPPVRQPPVWSSQDQVGGERMNENPVQRLQTAKDPKELLNAALVLARSKQPMDHEILLSYLQRPEFLNRMDSEIDYRAAASKRLRISRLLEALSMNEARSAQEVVVTLSGDQPFLRSVNRIDALIRASAAIRPPPSQLIVFWDAHCQHDDGFSHVTVSVLIKNGTEAALHLLERKMADPRHPDDDKIAWMRTDILSHRNDLLLLRSCERMLSGELPQKLRPYLVEALFDYRPAEWYSPASPYNPPDLGQASPQVREELRRVGQLALRTVALTPEQKEVVERSLKEIGNAR